MFQDWKIFIKVQMKFKIIILLINVVIYCKSSCDFDNNTVQQFKKKTWITNKRLSFRKLLNYLKVKEDYVNILNLNHSKLQCKIEVICNTKLSKTKISHEDCSHYEENIYNDYSFDNYTNLNLNNDSDFDSEIVHYSFCELYYKFEHEKKFVFLIDYFELWMFSHKNFTLHSNQIIKKCFFSRR